MQDCSLNQLKKVIESSLEIMKESGFKDIGKTSGRCNMKAKTDRSERKESM